MRVITPDDIAAVMALAAETVVPDVPAAGSGLAASFALRAHAVEAVMVLDPSRPPADALRLAGLHGGTDALRVGHCMSGENWSPRLLRVMVGMLRLVAPAPGARVTVRPRGTISITAAAMGDPAPGRSALDERRCAHG